MQKWEYRRVQIDGSSGKVTRWDDWPRPSPPRDVHVGEVLEVSGQEGWELVSTTGESAGQWLYFKRPIED